MIENTLNYLKEINKLEKIWPCQVFFVSLGIVEIKKH